MQPDEALRQLTEALPGLAAGTAIAASRLSVSTLEDPERPILVDLDEAGASRVAAPGAGKAQGAAYDCLHSLLLAESPLYAQWYFASVAQRLLAAAAQRGDEDDNGDGQQYCGNSSDDGEDGNDGCGGCSAGKSSEARDV
jgi:hypothetical protein